MESVKSFLSQTSNGILAAAGTVIGTVVVGAVVAGTNMLQNEVETIVPTAISQITHAPTATLEPPATQLQSPIVVNVNIDQEKPEWTPIPELVQPTIAPAENPESTIAPTSTVHVEIQAPPTTQVISTDKTLTATTAIQQGSTIEKDTLTGGEMPTVGTATESSPTPPEPTSTTEAPTWTPTPTLTPNAMPPASPTAVTGIVASTPSPVPTASATLTPVATPSPAATATAKPSPDFYRLQDEIGNEWNFNALQFERYVKDELDERGYRIAACYGEGSPDSEYPLGTQARVDDLEAKWMEICDDWITWNVGDTLP